MIDTVVSLVTSLPAVAGLAAGLATGTIALALPAGPARRKVAGAAYPVAAAVGALTAAKNPLVTLVALAVVAAGGVLWCRSRWPGAMVVAAGAAVMVYADSFPDRPLFRLAVVVWIPAVAAAVADVDRRWGSVTWALVGISILGVFAGVPEPAVALGLVAALPALAVAWATKAPVAWAGAPVVLLLTLAAVEGGFARTGSVVGALAGFGLLLVEPAAHLLGRVWPILSPVTPDGLGSRLLVVTQAMVVALTSRVAGFRRTSEPAFVLAVAALVVGWLAIRRRRTVSPKPAPEP